MEPGVNIIAGTGSVVYGAAGDGRTARAGGWGAGCDEGSCSWHGQKLVEAYTKQADGRMPRTALYEIFREHFHITEDEAFVMALNHEVASSRKGLAQLQYLLGRAWAAGDPAANAIYRLGAEELYLGVETVVRKLHLPWDGLRVSYSGGLFKAGECILSPLRERIEARAVELGAQFYMVKPFEPDHLLSHIRELADGSGGLLPMARTPVPVHVQSLDERLGSLFLTIGIPAHIKGYQYLRCGIKMVIEQPDVINRITKELYPSIAKHFGTSASKVERAIRHAIEVAWNRGRVETLNRAFGCRVCTPEDKPTNGEFIAMLADKLSLERSA